MCDYGKQVLKFYYKQGNFVGDENLGFEIYYNSNSKIVSVYDTYSTNMSIVTTDDEDYLINWYYKGHKDELYYLSKHNKDIKIENRDLVKNDIDYNKIMSLYLEYVFLYPKLT